MLLRLLGDEAIYVLMQVHGYKCPTQRSSVIRGGVKPLHKTLLFHSSVLRILHVKA